MTTKPVLPDSLEPNMIAPCGMNCGVCIGHLRDRKPCPGCNDLDDSSKPHHCVVCSIKTCENHTTDGGVFCLGCSKYPCTRIRQLDKRYRSKYRMSMIENFAEIQAVGLESFVEHERARWVCQHCGALLSVHKAQCLTCGESVEGTLGVGMNPESL